MGTKGVVASTAALSILLTEGIGDTIRVSLTPRPNGDRTEEVRRLVGLGASVLHEGDELTVLADPEGNEVCVE